MYCHQEKYVSSKKKAYFSQQKRSVFQLAGNMFSAIENLTFRGNLVFPLVGRSVYTAGKPAFKCSKLCLSQGNVSVFLVDKRRKLNVNKTFRCHAGCLLNVLCTFNLRPACTGTVFPTELSMLLIFGKCFHQSEKDCSNNIDPHYFKTYFF